MQEANAQIYKCEKMTASKTDTAALVPVGGQCSHTVPLRRTEME